MNQNLLFFDSVSLHFLTKNGGVEFFRRAQCDDEPPNRVDLQFHQTILGVPRVHGDFPSDLVLYHCDPSYDWSPVNQLKRALKGELGKSKLSVRVLADALRTSPTQVVRLLEENRASKQLLQLFKLAELAGYRIEFRLRKKTPRHRR